ncbi:MAG: DUF933 domain-containing protein [Clostridiaceae bacterium]|nr:DUF933 domain-containing protein [Clostridiaceae bacterium]
MSSEMATSYYSALTSDLEASESLSAIRERKRVRFEGKVYTFQDGKVILFHFNI